MSPPMMRHDLRSCSSAQTTSSLVKRPLSQFVTASLGTRQSMSIVTYTASPSIDSTNCWNLSRQSARRIAPRRLRCLTGRSSAHGCTSNLPRRSARRFPNTWPGHQHSKFPQPQTLTFRTFGNSNARFIHAPQDHFGGRMSQSGWLSNETSTNGSEIFRSHNAVRW